MNEEALSLALFKLAEAHDSLQVLSWQAVNGKGYFTADVKIRLSTGERMEPDLIIASHTSVWLIEVKTLHTQALADEAKLARLFADIESSQLLEQVSLRSQTDVRRLVLEAAVAFVKDDVTTQESCKDDILHVCWETHGESSLESILDS